MSHLQTEKAGVAMLDDDLNNLRDDAANQEVNINESNVFVNQQAQKDLT